MIDFMCKTNYLLKTQFFLLEWNTASLKIKFSLWKRLLAQIAYVAPWRKHYQVNDCVLIQFMLLGIVDSYENDGVPL